MQLLGVVGPSDSGKTTLVERIVNRLSERGRVATIKRMTHAPEIDTDGKDTHRHRSAGAETTYGMTDDDGWFATGEERTLDETLAELATTHDYTVVEGYSEADLPQVVLAGREHAGTAIAEGEDADAVDVPAVIESLDGLEPFESLESLVASAKRAPEAERAGAIATFTGRVRAKDGDEDAPTEYLQFEKYDGVADDRMATISEELESRDGLQRVLMHHRTGVIEYGEDIVFVVVLAGHREEAFRTVEDGINRLKDEVPLFKKEVTVDEEFWVHQRE
ncbi:molybdopterin synthase [Natranaeroarchaeum aerophilus]|uniref:Molybdopterin synthase n=1 Tax=Natranaeroarchaeum aerophilus TaxID=2917711 RepID=A0AAE3FN70_9EURY|nr:molybdopterin synthase [Natranaeroarchaeum aerophilus]MCL9812378.1 molybdopterin synthase [Natranaeroarchaeum aerophilus]